MINFFSNFTTSLITSVLLITIIEIILPDNKNKKYVTFTATVILSMIIINPLANLINKDFKFENLLENEIRNFSSEEYAVKMEYAKQKNIDDLYDKSLKEDVINRLESSGYKVKKIYLDVDRKSYEPIKIGLEIEHGDGSVQKVVIDVSNDYSDDVSIFEIAKIKDMLFSTYNINQKNITINNK